MIIDGTLILVFLLSGWIGWSLRIYVDLLKMGWIILFACLLWVGFPHFMSFVEQSSANLPALFYYAFGVLMAGLIFLSFFMLVRGRKSASGFRRLAGSVALAVISFYSLVIVMWSMATYGWIDLSESFVFILIPEGFLNPFQ